MAHARREREAASLHLDELLELQRVDVGVVLDTRRVNLDMAEAVHRVGHDEGEAPAVAIGLGDVCLEGGADRTGTVAAPMVARSTRPDGLSMRQ